MDLRAPDNRVLDGVLAQPKRLALLVYLAAARSAGFHRRDRLVALFWPELDDARARDALSQALRFLRQALGSDAVATRGVDEVGLDRDRVWCDAVEFRAALDAGRPVDALQLYRGNFLDGVFVEEASGFEEWVESERAALRELAARGARQLAEQHDEHGSHTVAVGWGRRAVELAPDDERGFRRLLGLLDRAGDRAGALQAYDGFARRLRAEYGAEPAAETRAMVEGMRRASGMPAIAVATPPEHPVLSPDVPRVPRAEAAIAAAPLTVGSSLANGNYVIEGILGTGGMATVYLAHDVRHDRRVAVKVLRPEIAAAVGAKGLLREIRIAARLQHPHIVPLFDSGESDGCVFYVMPCIVGESLRARLQREPVVPLGIALRIARDLADALAHAHRCGIVHRDVKPDNILLSGDPATGEFHALVADFGVAKAIDETRSKPDEANDGALTLVDGVVGTPRYMAPEQAIGRRVDSRADVYAWGVVTHELLRGAHPFAEVDLTDGDGRPPLGIRLTLSEVEHLHVSPSLSALIARCLETNPDSRPASGAAVLRVVEQALTVAGRSPPLAAQRLRLPTWRTMSSPFRRVRPADAQPQYKPWIRQRGWTVALVGAFLLGAIPIARTLDRGAGRQQTVPNLGDSAILVVLPLERERGDEPSNDDGLLHEAFSSWGGIGLVDRFNVADALRRRGPVRSHTEAAALAAEVGADWYVRGNLRRTGGGRHVYAALYNVGSATAVHQAVADVPSDSAQDIQAYTRLAGSLLLKGANVDSTSGPAGSRSIPALQAVLRAQSALDEWDLASADSLFEAAATHDPDYARAVLWVAQVRAWRELPSDTWSALAERARGGAGRLSEKERRLADALGLLAGRRYADACGVYDELRRRNEKDFAAWFGLGMCRSMDRVVIRDPASPSGWRYRSSFHDAITAYTRAFETLPSVHRGYERGAFEGLLRALLLVRTEFVVGYALGRDSAMFLARAGWIGDGDTLALIPYPYNLSGSGVPNAAPPGFDAAHRYLAAQFSKIAAGWSSAFPRSAAAKQAVAIALELAGDPSAIDTLRVARRLAQDLGKQHALAIDEVMLRVKFGVPADVAGLRAARLLGDSLLARVPRTPVEAYSLAPVAAVAGRCRQVDELVRAKARGRAPLPIAPHLVDQSQTLLAQAALGCSQQPTTPTPRELAGAIDREYGQLTPDKRWIDETLLFRPALLSADLDSVVIARLAMSSQHALIRAARAVTQYDASTARRVLSEFRSSWRPDRGPPTPDIVYPGARLLVSIGDTIAAIEWLDRTLNGVRDYDPKFLHEPARAAAFIRAVALRADLAAAVRDDTGARTWGEAASVLWSNAESDLQPIARRMSQHARRR